MFAGETSGLPDGAVNMADIIITQPRVGRGRRNPAKHGPDLTVGALVTALLASAFWRGTLEPTEVRSHRRWRWSRAERL